MKNWRKEDNTYLRRYAAKRSIDEMADRFRTSADEVVKQLEDLKLQSRDGHGYREPYVDPTMGDFEAGLEAFHGRKYAAAIKSFQNVVDGAEQFDLSQRARTYLAASETAQGKNEGGVDSDPFTEAVFAKNIGDLDTALEMCSAGGRKGKDERFAYLAACVHALNGNATEAMHELRLAIDMNSENRVHAYFDSDFEGLRGDEAFGELIHVDA